MTHADAHETVETLLEAVPPVQSRTIAMGFTASLDVLLASSPSLTAHMRTWCAEGTETAAAVWRAILAAQTHCAREGRGGELVLEPATVLARFEEHAMAMTIGGTGVRAAAQAARLGQRSIVSIPATDSRLASLLAGHLIALGPASCSTRLPTHYVIELPGVLATSEPTGERVKGQRPNRLILRGEETQMPLLPDSFITGILACKLPVRLLLLSGFNTYTSMPELEQALGQAAAWLGALRRQAPQIWTYLEMAGFASRAALHHTLRTIGPLMDAVGMNEDECEVALDPSRPMETMPPNAQSALMRETLTQYGLARLVVHTAWMSGYLGRASLPPSERIVAARALALGNTAAGFRFANGFDGVQRDLQGAAHAWKLAPQGVECAAVAEGYPDLVIIPAWDIPRGVGAIGLGDSFTGALLTGLDPPAKALP